MRDLFDHSLDLGPYLLTPGARVVEREERSRLARLAHDHARTRQLILARKRLER